MILREKIKNNLKSFQIHIFTFQNILHEKKTPILVADMGVVYKPVDHTIIYQPFASAGCDTIKFMVQFSILSCCYLENIKKYKI